MTPPPRHLAPLRCHLTLASSHLTPICRHLTLERIHMTPTSRHVTPRQRHVAQEKNHMDFGVENTFSQQLELILDGVTKKSHSHMAGMPL
jgi:hypothetical protein